MCSVDRLTRAIDNAGSYAVDDAQAFCDERGYRGPAIDKLAQYENFHEDLTAKQAEISRKLESLRSEGRTRSATFHQLLANKLANQNILILLETYGLE